MKKTDIKATEAINKKASLVTLDKEALHNTGRAFGGIHFWSGDELVFPDWDDLDTCNDSFEDTDGKAHPFPVVKIGLNNVVRYIPIGSLRRFAFGIDDYTEKYAQIDAFHRSIVDAQDDFELLKLFAGNTFKVNSFFDARMKARDKVTGKIVPYNKDDVKTFTTMRWPIFTKSK